MLKDVSHNYYILKFSYFLLYKLFIFFVSFCFLRLNTLSTVLNREEVQKYSE